MKKHPDSSLLQFNQVNKSALRSLTQHRYKSTKVSRVMVHIDYHVEVNKDSYLVRYTLIKQQIEAHVTG